MNSYAINGRIGDGALTDRLTILPRHLIDCILEHLSVIDAARTRILSKTWMNIWEHHPQLVFDLQFFSQPSKRIKREIVDVILFLHTGPIFKFHLYIPPNLFKPVIPLFIGIWIKHVSTKGVRDLKLTNSEKIPRLQIPSSLFSCSHLTKLNLTKCILNPPHNMGGFPNLISVELVNVTITADMTFGSQLMKLDIAFCRGIEHLGCQFTNANRLLDLAIVDGEEMDWGWFEFTKYVNTLFLACYPFSNPKKNISLDKLLVNMPNINRLVLCGSTFECLEPCPKSLAIMMENLNTLHLHELKLSNFSQISNAFCLIRSSPNLQDLLIALELDATDSTFESYLDSPDCMYIILDRLQTIKIRDVMGSRTELYLIKFLLASSPSLKTITLLRESTISDPRIVSNIAQKLMRFPRASTAAEMIWI